MATDLRANAEMFLAVAVLGFSLILAAVSAVSYQRLQNRRALFIGAGFVLFAVKGAYLVQQSLASRGSEAWILPVAGLDLAVLLLLYLAIRSR